MTEAALTEAAATPAAATAAAATQTDAPEAAATEAASTIDAASSEPLRPPTGRLTFEEFLEWCDEDTHAEWIDGEVIVMSPASRAHQELVTFLVTLLKLIVEQDDSGAVLPAPFQMRLADPARSREPDILFVGREHLDRLRPTYLDGPADLVVEITSPESVARDRGDKFVEYERAGVSEYWLIDRDRRSAELYQLDAAGLYRRVPVDDDSVYQSRVLPRLRLSIGWLWQDPLPKVLTALTEMQRI